MNIQKNVCENCGAPLRETKTKGKYHCEYCQGEYFGENYSPRKNSLIFTILAGIIGIGIFACLFSSLFSSDSAQNSAKTNIRNPIPTPVMLNALPEAVMAGTPVAYQGMEILVNPEVIVKSQEILLKLTIQNWKEQSTILRYRPNQIILYDDLGNRYNLALGSCDLDIPFRDRQVSFEPGEKIAFSSETYWCTEEKSLPAFFGVIPIGAKNLYLKLENFGVFQNITFVIEL